MCEASGRSVAPGGRGGGGALAHVSPSSLLCRRGSEATLLGHRPFAGPRLCPSVLPSHWPFHPCPFCPRPRRSALPWASGLPSAPSSFAGISPSSVLCGEAQGALPGVHLSPLLPGGFSCPVSMEPHVCGLLCHSWDVPAAQAGFPGLLPVPSPTKAMRCFSPSLPSTVQAQATNPLNCRTVCL